MPQKTSGFAISSFILGLVSLLLLTFAGKLALLAAILALVFGVLGYSKIKKGLEKGKVLALVGITIGSIIILLLILAIIALITNIPSIFPLSFLMLK